MKICLCGVADFCNHKPSVTDCAESASDYYEAPQQTELNTEFLFLSFMCFRPYMVNQ